MSTREEEALIEWGVGRPLLANSLLAVGGTLLVAFAEKVWGPAVVGTLLVAAAGYRVQGALTKVLRVMSVDWAEHKLVPSRIHGTERALQLVLVTLVALADLLDDRVLLLASLICASVQVVAMEYVGQAVLTWGYKEYNRFLCVQLAAWSIVCLVGVGMVWLMYVFAGYCGAFFCFSGVVQLLQSCCWKRYAESVWFKAVLIVTFCVCVGVGFWLAVIGWDDADLKFSPQSLQPWRWPLLGSPDSFSASARIVGLWLGVIVGSYLVVYIIVGVLSFRISSDGGKVVALGKRTCDREGDGVFSHYHVTSIPSRNLLVPYAGQQARDEGQQPAPVASVV